MRLLFVALSLVMLLAGCGGGEPADETVSELVTALSESDYEAAYDLLHPAHQAIVPEQLFADCGRQAELSNPARVDSFDITGETERTRTIPELGETDVTEVGVNLTQGSQTFFRTWDVVKDDGDWRWLIDADALTAYREGRCPGETASAQ